MGPVVEQPKRARTPARCGVPRCARLGARSTPPIEHSEKSDGKKKSASAVARAFVEVAVQALRPRSIGKYTGHWKRNREDRPLQP
jgi:hypothetical protein